LGAREIVSPKAKDNKTAMLRFEEDFDIVVVLEGLVV
jgi:hypothetical protein